MIEDPFGLERITVELPAGASILVYPRLVDVDRLFPSPARERPRGGGCCCAGPRASTSTASATTSRESLRRVHWPTTARRGQLMVKELEDSPRDETAVLLDADAAAAVGEAPDSSFELAVRPPGRSSGRTPPAGAGRR